MRSDLWVLGLNILSDVRLGRRRIGPCRPHALPSAFVFCLATLGTPDDLVAQVTSGAMRLPSYVEATYGAGILEMVRQTYDGRMDFAATTTTTVEDLIGRKPLTLREWIARYRDSVLAVGAQAAKGPLKE
jgi:hypothetical protein